jgi:hypothetical protein
VVRAFSVTAPDELSAQDLAAGEPAIYRPVVAGRGARWRVRISAEATDWREIEDRVTAWLRRRGIGEASIEVAGISTAVFARPTAEHTPPPATHSLIRIRRSREGWPRIRSKDARASGHEEAGGAPAISSAVAPPVDAAVARPS